MKLVVFVYALLFGTVQAFAFSGFSWFGGRVPYEVYGEEKGKVYVEYAIDEEDFFLLIHFDGEAGLSTYIGIAGEMQGSSEEDVEVYAPRGQNPIGTGSCQITDDHYSYSCQLQFTVGVGEQAAKVSMETEIEGLFQYLAAAAGYLAARSVEEPYMSISFNRGANELSFAGELKFNKLKSERCRSIRSPVRC